MRKNLSNFLFYTEPKIYFFSNLFEFNFLNKKTNFLNYSYTTTYLRNLYNDIFIINQFKHSVFLKLFELFFQHL